MADNPHLLANEIHGTFGTGITGTNFATRITGLANDYPTGVVANRHIYDRVLREYYRNLDNHGFTGFQTDAVDAGFTPLTITGFFDTEVNVLLGVEAGSFLDSLTLADFQFQLSDVGSNIVQARVPGTNAAIIDAADVSASDFAMLRVKCTALQAGQSLQITDLDYTLTATYGASGPSNVQMKIPTDEPRTNDPGVFDVIDKGTVNVNDNSSFFELGTFNCTRGSDVAQYVILITNITFSGTDGGSSVGPVTISIPRYTIPTNVDAADYTVPAGEGIPQINFQVNNLPED